MIRKNRPGPTKNTMKKIERALRSLARQQAQLRNALNVLAANQSQRSIAVAINALTLQVGEISIAIREVGSAGEIADLRQQVADALDRITLLTKENTAELVGGLKDGDEKT